VIRIGRMTLHLPADSRDPAAAARLTATQAAHALQGERAQIGRLTVSMPAGADVGRATTEALRAHQRDTNG
jgi:hypothetical protein